TASDGAGTSYARGASVSMLADGSSNYLPHCHIENCVSYTGTHDNAPLAEWRETAKPEDIAFAKKYLNLTEDEGFNYGVIRGGMSTVARLFVAQMQDYLDLGVGHRINTPGSAAGNWTWRMLPGETDPALAERIRALTKMYGRLSRPALEEEWEKARLAWEAKQKAEGKEKAKSEN
ncbi:MAG: 4-alpha-glucanotransferase, partial [Oscillospiraceae bacterium]|nr:4-alpha-glucanotransferase [Oscillospiraceae bacterium]